ncbi:MAG: PD40 domain-containing protein [Flavobacteriales bacterium]|nr:PD40 domain-containing protein [Flavobacteriales bacterium]
MIDSYQRLLLVFLASAFTVTFTCSPANAQEYGVVEGMGEKELFKMGNYRGALAGYLKLLEEDKDNLQHKYVIAQCYLNINDDKSFAVPYLETIWKEDKSNSDVLFDLGRAYHFLLNFDKAINAFNEYKALVNDPIVLENVDRQIEMCHNGKELVKYPLDLTFENLGKKVNSPYPDFTAVVPNDESYMVFTSRRKGNRGNLLDYDGYYTSDVYMSRVKRGEFGKAANVSNINSESDEEVAGISPDGSNVIIFVDDVFQNIFANIYISKKKGRSLSRLVSISDHVNTPTTLETSAAITTDGQFLYFASDKKGGFGGMDLYVSKVLPDGTWGEALNLGPIINSKYNEEYPVISYDGKELHFSSQGHTSMGGYDLFVSKKDDKTNIWSKPSNLGYPLNTAEDNMHISFSASWDMESETESKKYGYVSAYRKGGFGDLDIYRVAFGDVEERLTAIVGEIREKVLIDYSVRKTFYYYTRQDQRIMIPEELYPWYDRSWTEQSKKEVIVKPGHQYKTLMYFEKEGQLKPFSTKKFPKDDPNWKFVKIRNSEIRIKNYTAPKVLYEELPLPETNIYITDLLNGDEYTYVASQKGRYLIILATGKYEMTIEATGYKPKIVPLNIYGKGSYRAEIVQNHIFEKGD